MYSFLKRIRSNLLCRGLIVKPRSASVEKVKTSWPRKHAQRNSSPYDSFISFLQHFERSTQGYLVVCFLEIVTHSILINHFKSGLNTSTEDSVHVVTRNVILRKHWYDSKLLTAHSCIKETLIGIKTAYCPVLHNGNTSRNPDSLLLTLT